MKVSYTLYFFVLNGIIHCSGLQAQAVDSLPLRILDNVLIESYKLESDPRLFFYKPSAGSTTEELLCHMRGVALVRRGAYGQEPVIRGMSGGQLNVTIDGMKMFGACTDKMDPVTIYVEPQNLEQLQVSTGSEGSYYGATVGSSVNMQLAQPRLNQPFSGTAGTSYYAASQGITSYAILEGGTATGAMRLSTTYRNHNNYRAGTGAVIAYTQYEKLNVTLAGKWALKPGDTLMADVLADYGWNIGFPALPMDVGLAKTWVAGITLEQSRPEAFFNAWKTKLYANHVHHEMDDSQRENVVMPMDMPGQTATIGFYTEGQAKPKGKHRMNMRADGYYTYALAEMTMYAEGESPMYMQTWPESGRVVAGIFAEDHIQMNSETEATLNTRLDWAGTQLFEGIGIDQLRIFYSDLQPFDQRFSVSVNASVSRYVSRDVRVGLQTGYAQRIPTLSEYAGFYLFNSMDGFDYVGNPYLKNEQSLMLGVNANYLRGPVEADVNFFTQRLPDYIFSYTDSQLSPMTPGAAGVRVYQNVPYAHFTGAEAMITWKISSHFSLLDQVNLVMARLHNDQAVPLIPPLRNQLSVQYHSGNWVAQADLDAAVAQNQVNSSYGEDPTPAYAVMNAFVEYSGLAGWQFRFGVDNVLDATYYTHLDWGNVLRPGRNLYASVRFRW